MTTNRHSSAGPDEWPSLAAPARRALASAGIHTLRQLTAYTERELAQLHGMGPQALSRLREALAERRLAFRSSPALAASPRPPAGILAQMDALHGPDPEARYQAYQALLTATDQPVLWAYTVWETLVADLTHTDHHVRSIAAQLLANLARSDPQGRMRRDFRRLLAVTRDERYVTARHALQSIWKVGLAGKAQVGLVVRGLSRRFQECAVEKNGTLTRYDILVALQQLYSAIQDEAIRAKALALIETETDLKYRRKYAKVWSVARRSA